MLLKWAAKNTRSYGSLYSTDLLLLSYFCKLCYLFMTMGTHITFTGTYNNVNTSICTVFILIEARPFVSYK